MYMKNVCLAVALMSAAPMIAAEPVDTTRSYELQSVQVVATRAGNRTPMAVTNFDKQQINKFNFGKDIPFLLSLTPSVTTTSDAGNGIGYTSLRVRGIDPSRINITANGIPMNDAESSTVFFVNLSDFASSMQGMQIQRGAGTSTNGAGAFGATLNMQTENLDSKPFFRFDGSAGSYLTHKETVRFGTGLLGGHWAVQGRLSHLASDGYLDRATTRLNSYFLQAGYVGENTVVKFITFNNSETTYHAWNYASKYEQSLYGRRYNSCGEYWDDEGNVHYYDDQNDVYHQQNYQLLWTQRFLPSLDLNVALHWTRGDGYYEEYKSNKNLEDYGLATEKFKTDLVRQKKMENDFYGAIASLNYHPNSRLKTVLGGGWNKYVGDHFGKVLWVKKPFNNLPIGHEYYRNRAWKSDFNVYAKAEWEFLRGLSGFADLQYRHVGYRLQDPADWYIGGEAQGLWAHDDFDFFNPKVGLNYELNRHNRLYASYAMSHREPVRNNYQDNNVKHLKAERLQDIEVGYKYSSRRFTAGVNLYYMLYDDQYVLTGQLNNIGQMIASNENSGKSYRAGIELEGAWKPVNWFRWDANLTLSRARNKDWTITTDDDQVVNLGETHTSFSPDVIFNNIFTFEYRGFQANIQSRFVGEQYMTNTDHKYYTNYNADGTEQSRVGMMLDKFFTTNVNLSYTFEAERFGLKKLGLKDATLGVTLYNIFNAKYDNNGWAAPGYRMNGGKVEAYCTDDLYEAGFAPSAPFNFLFNLSLGF